MILLGLALALAVGLALGLLGGGGSILTVPIFVYVMGFEAKRAIAMSLIVVGVVSLVGAAGHWRAGRVDLRVAAIFGVIAMAAAYAGARLGALVSGPAQLVCLSVVICVTAVLMFRNAAGGPARADTAGTRADEVALAPRSLARLAPVGIGVGLLTGLIGVGGGFLIVPALVLLGRVPIKLAIGTSLLVIAMNCVAGEVGYLGRVSIPWVTVASFTAVATGGILAGTRLCGVVSTAALKRGFAVLLLAVGIFVLAKNRHAFDSAGAAGPTHSGVVRGAAETARRS